MFLGRAAVYISVVAFQLSSLSDNGCFLNPVSLNDALQLLTLACAAQPGVFSLAGLVPTF